MKRINGFLVLLIILNAIIYHRWLSFSIFTYSDWLFFFSESLADFLTPTVWNAIWVFNFGTVDIILWKLPVYLLTGLFGISGFDYNVAEKFIVFWPIVFGLSIGSFLLLKHIIKSDVAALIGSFVFSYSTYFLSINTQGHQFLPAAFAFATFAILFYIKLLDERKLYLAVLTGLFLFLTGAYDLRSLYITVGILGLYFIYYFFISFREIRKNLLKVVGLNLLLFFLLLLLSLYWLLPILNVDALSNNVALGRQIFGSEFYNIQSSLTTFFPFWTGKETAWFTVQNIHWYFWVYPILAIVGLIVNRGNAKIVFFGLIAAIGIFLSKQADVPFTNVYSLLYQYVPGFNAFREASKFDYMVSLSYAVLIGGFVKWLLVQDWRGKWVYTKYLVIFGIVFLALWNTKPILTGEIKSLFVPRTIPQEFITVKNLILDQPEYFRTFWINMSTHWLPFNTMHPEIDGAAMLNRGWQPFVQESFSDRRKAEGEKIMTAMRDQAVNRLLDLSSVKYVIVPLHDKETGHNIIKGFGKDYQYYQEALDHIPYLRKVESIPSNILVYENSDFRPHLYITKTEEELVKVIPYQKVEHDAFSPSEYKIKLDNISSPVYLNFTDNYHPSWRLRVGEFNWINILRNSNYFLADRVHIKNVAGFNSFLIDPEKICKQYQCQKNSDGSYDIDMTLYFRPQSYLYLGMIISGTTLLLSFLYLLYYGITKIQRKN